MLIIDEVQTGFFRTGKYFATQYSGVRPDLMIFAKGVANGYPLSGIVAPKAIMDKLPVGSLGGTYAGNAVSCAAGVAVQDVFQTEDFETNVALLSEQMRETLEGLQKSPKTGHMIADVRISGLMNAIEFRSASSPLSLEGLTTGTAVPKDIGKRVQQYCLDHDLMILTTSCFDTIRFIPPLICNQEEMAQGLAIFKDAVEHVAREG